MIDEKRYIEYGAALDAVFGQFCTCSDETEQSLNAIVEEIRAIPAADVAPVVRCSECVFWDATVSCEGRRDAERESLASGIARLTTFAPSVEKEQTGVTSDGVLP